MIESLTFLLSLWGSPAPATCPDTAATINVRERLSGTTLDLSKSRRDLQLMSRTVPYRGHVMQGLTQMDFKTSFTLSVSLVETKSGEWCAAVERIDVEFGMTSPAKVMVAREIERDSCTFRTVIQHEKEHVAIGEQAVRDGSAAIAAGLRKLLETTFPVRASSKKEAYRASWRAVEDVVNKHAGDAFAVSEAAHEAIDSLDSYRRLKEMCL